MKCFLKCAGYFAIIASTVAVIAAILIAFFFSLMVLAGYIAAMLGLGGIAANIIYIAELIVIAAAGFTIADRKKICS